MNEPSVVAVAGSCVTRDNFNSRFNPDYKRWFTCELTANQTSMIAMMSPPIEPVFQPIGKMSKYDRWNVAADLSREFLDKLIELQPDYLILDFFGDVHFGVLRLDDGRYVTDNRWKLWRTDFYRDRLESGGFERIHHDSHPEQYFELWTEALDRFAALVAQRCPRTKVVVHRGYNTGEATVDGDLDPVPLRRHKKLARFDVAAGNAFWDRLDDHAIGTHGWSSIDLRAERHTSTDEHPWGAFYVHYAGEYYHRFMAELLAIRGRNEAPDWLAAMLDLITRAHDESTARQNAVHDARLRGMRTRLEERERRIRELEGLGVIRSVKFAVGQRIRRRRARRR